MIKKRAQITLFIILGIFILFMFAIVYYYINNLNKDKLDVGITLTSNKQNYQATNAYLKSLVRSVTYDSIKQIALQGGEFIPTDYKELTIEDRNIMVSYALKNNINKLSNINIKDELSKAILYNLKEKIDFSFIEAEGGNYTINWDMADCIVTFTEKNVKVKVNLPIKVEINNAKTYTLSNIQTEVPVELLKVYNSINEIVNNISASSDPYNLLNNDYSCDRIRICYNGNNVLRIRQYKPFYDEPGLLFLVAVDREPIINRCTRLDNINEVNGGSCP